MAIGIHFSDKTVTVFLLMGDIAGSYQYEFQRQDYTLADSANIKLGAWDYLILSQTK